MAEAGAGAGRRVALALYKQLLQTARRLPEAQRAAAAQEVRDKFKAHAAEGSPEKVQELLNLAQSKLGYLKIVTPRTSRDATGKARLVLRDGKWVEGSARLMDRAPHDKTSVDADALAKHNYLMERQHFMHRRR
ncbi:Hypothetical Protein FCC1311_098232 [Hondaea fermentalgiana]|uniref:Complex 1 LYR protein domain-containing protein n=1 Tax=Hondaea fermentalgiana TaxID=2315210 RepID=A0A2R5GRX5_9STRA|nr:Hypothetical Protein FCC1311_098232 [Hondaea fermentalgiana]|eukprot:GBG33600.1 Hypothetical Protein FCC1311_098232 [Hondaea fermentalgiana]